MCFLYLSEDNGESFLHCDEAFTFIAMDDLSWTQTASFPLITLRHFMTVDTTHNKQGKPFWMCRVKSYFRTNTKSHATEWCLPDATVTRHRHQGAQKKSSNRKLESSGHTLKNNEGGRHHQKTSADCSAWWFCLNRSDRRPALWAVSSSATAR